jgi:dTDP-4-amino-4,6-dideoxygalactose transaminase/nucleoside-diphosphate-sugar epimerase
VVGRVLLTGAHGLIGEATQRALVARGTRLLALDVREGHGAASEVEVRRADVRDAAALDPLFDRVDAVIHLAAVVGVDAYLADPDAVLDVNVLGTRNVLRGCEARGLPVLVASTSEVYGRAGGVLTEASEGLYGPPSAQRWCYATSKRAAEHYTFAAAARGLPCAVVRFFNVYGPRLDAPGYERVVTRFVRAVQRGEALIVHGDGSDVRAFCYVDDAVEGMLRVFDALIAGRGEARGRAFNVGRDEPVTIGELARSVVALAAHAPGVVTRPAAADHGPGFDPIPFRTPDLSAGWRAPTSLQEGLRRVLAAHDLLRADAPAAPDPPIPWVRPLFEPDAALLGSMLRSLAAGVVTNEGPVVAAFEHELAGWLGVSTLAATANGTTALTLAALALGLRGRAVMPAFTFVATAAAMARAGVGALYCDIDPERWTLDPDALARTLAAHPEACAVVAVNVYGVAPDLARIGALCRAAGIPLVYDNAHGLGTRVDGARVPPEPDVVAFSLHATKVLPAVEGGAVVARDAALDRELRRLRRHGLADNPYATSASLNGRIDELRAAVGRHLLRGLDGALARRRAYAERLRAAVAAAGHFTLQHLPPGVESNHQNLGVLCAEIDLARAAFEAGGVGTRRYFYPGLHQMQSAAGGAALPVTERVAEAVLCLPLHARMDDRTLARVEAAIRRADAAQGGT